MKTIISIYAFKDLVPSTSLLHNMICTGTLGTTVSMIQIELCLILFMLLISEWTFLMIMASCATQYLYQ